MRSKNASIDLGETGAKYAKYLKELVTPLVLNNTFTEEATILQGLIKAHPEMAADPDLVEYITDGRIDTKKLLADDKTTATNFANAAHSNYEK